MSANNISETQRKMDSVERKLMYKSHGQWTVKTTGTIALGALAAVAGVGNVTAHADTVKPVATQSTPAVNETVSTPTQDQQATTVSPVVTQVNNTVNQAVTTSRPSIVADGGSIESTSLQVVNQSNVANVATEAQNQAANVAATVSGDAIINNALAHVWSQTVTRGSAIDVSSMTPEQIASLTASEVDTIGETQNVNEQLSEAVVRTSQSIHEIGGKTIIVPVKQTEGISI